MTTVVAGGTRRPVILNTRNVAEIELLTPSGATLQTPDGQNIIIDRQAVSGSGGTTVISGGGRRTSTVAPRT